jgi:hypothetical protein
LTSLCDEQCLLYLMMWCNVCSSRCWRSRRVSLLFTKRPS